MITLYNINRILILFKLKYKEFDFDLNGLWDWYEFTNNLKLNLLEKTVITWVNSCEQAPKLGDILYLYTELYMKLKK